MGAEQRESMGRLPRGTPTLPPVNSPTSRLAFGEKRKAKKASKARAKAEKQGMVGQEVPLEIFVDDYWRKRKRTRRILVLSVLVACGVAAVVAGILLVVVVARALSAVRYP